jgi:Flp pilus assembly protein protease CpaA
MEAAKLLHQIQLDLLIHSKQYILFVEAATIALLCYIGIMDFRTFRIQNLSLMLLLVLYVLYAIIARSQYEILSNIILGVITFGLLLWFYAKRVLGGGDVKLVPVVCLWVGTHGALLFSALLLMLLGLHLVAARMGWARINSIGGRRAIPYAPSVAGALIGTIALGFL